MTGRRRLRRLDVLPELLVWVVRNRGKPPGYLVIAEVGWRRREVESVFGKLPLKLLHQHRAHRVDVHPAADRRNSRWTPVAGGLRVKLLATSPLPCPISSTAPNNDGPRPNGVLVRPAALLERLIHLMAEGSEPISDEVVRDLAAVVGLDKVQQFPIPGCALPENISGARPTHSDTRRRRTGCMRGFSCLVKRYECCLPRLLTTLSME